MSAAVRTNLAKSLIASIPSCSIPDNRDPSSCPDQAGLFKPTFDGTSESTMFVCQLYIRLTT